MSVVAATRYPLSRSPGLLPSLSLPSQFALTGGAIMLVAMLLVGLFTSSVVSWATIENKASSTALFMDSFLAPLVQELATDDVLRPENARELSRLLGGDAFRDRFPHLEIWKEGGPIAFSTTPELIGRQFPPPAGLLAALSGEVSAHYTDLKAGEHVVRDFSTSYLEIYVPIREHLSGRIVAVAEIHEVTAPLDQKLFYVRLQSWLAAAAATLMIMVSLFGIVYRGSRVIEAQQAELRRRLAEIEEVSRQNLTLRERAQRASSRVAELTEASLRRIGAELHDGPAQLIGLAVLKVEHVRRARTAAARERELQAINTTLSEAIREVRTISKGLMLPEIEHLELSEVLDRVVRLHEMRTGTEVEVEKGTLPDRVIPAVKICAYRFIQEGLNNAFRHAGGDGQSIAGGMEGSVLVLTVRDKGGTNSHPAGAGSGLGLVGLRGRVESLGGTFRVERRREGMAIEMRLPITEETQDD